MKLTRLDLVVMARIKFTGTFMLVQYSQEALLLMMLVTLLAVAAVIAVMLILVPMLLSVILVALLLMVEYCNDGGGGGGGGGGGAGGAGGDGGDGGDGGGEHHQHNNLLFVVLATRCTSNFRLIDDHASVCVKLTAKPQTSATAVDARRHPAQRRTGVRDDSRGNYIHNIMVQCNRRRWGQMVA